MNFTNKAAKQCCHKEASVNLAGVTQLDGGVLHMMAGNGAFSTDHYSQSWEPL